MLQNTSALVRLQPEEQPDVDITIHAAAQLVWTDVVLITAINVNDIISFLATQT